MNPPFNLVACVERLIEAFPDHEVTGLAEQGGKGWVFEISPKAKSASGQWGRIRVDRGATFPRGDSLSDSTRWRYFEDEINGLRRDMEAAQAQAGRQETDEELEASIDYKKSFENQLRINVQFGIREKALSMALAERRDPFEPKPSTLKRARKFEAYLSGNDQKPTSSRPEEILDVLEGLLDGSNAELLDRVYAAILEHGGQVDRKLS